VLIEQVVLSPYGILDIEMAINFPKEAEFPYAEMAYSPAIDDSVIQAITTYGAWND
jgi:hypothetical protein